MDDDCIQRSSHVQTEELFEIRNKCVDLKWQRDWNLRFKGSQAIEVISAKVLYTIIINTIILLKHYTQSWKC